jgi:hypothetical protein
MNKNKKNTMEYLEKYDKLVKLLTEEFEIEEKKFNLKDDFEKFFVKGNRTAGTRIRRVMQELKKFSQEIRNDVQDYKDKI